MPVKQRPLTAAQAWEKMEKALSQPRRRKEQNQIDEAVRLLDEQPSDVKRKRYKAFLLDVLQRCGPVCVALCAAGLGQAHIANMNEKARSTLLAIVDKRKSSAGIAVFQGLAPARLNGAFCGCVRVSRANWLDIQLSTRPPPPEAARDRYHTYKFARMDLGIFANYFSPRLLQVMDDSALRAWEIRKSSLTGTEVVRTDVPWLVYQDCLMFLEVGSAQDIIVDLFSPEKRVPHPSCCEWKPTPFVTQGLTWTEGPEHYFLRGASTSAISTFLGAYLAQAIDESDLRVWEKENQQGTTTDCVEMQLLRDRSSRQGILKLRIGWRRGQAIVNSLYT